jgi:hypothetical protein
MALAHRRPCIDNAVVESFFATLLHNQIWLRCDRSRFVM